MRVAVVGKIRSGKTTVVNIIKGMLDESDSIIIEFSDSLREATEVMYPATKGIKDRERLIAVGQHMRKLDVDVWTNIVEHKIRVAEEEGYANILVSSVRQPNEVEMLLRNGFDIIQVVSDEEIRIQRCVKAGDKFDKVSFNDYTETALDDYSFKYIIENDGSYSEFCDKVDEVIRKIVLKL